MSKRRKNLSVFWISMIAAAAFIGAAMWGLELSPGTVVRTLLILSLGLLGIIVAALAGAAMLTLLKKNFSE